MTVNLEQSKGAHKCLRAAWLTFEVELDDSRYDRENVVRRATCIARTDGRNPLVDNLLIYNQALEEFAAALKMASIPDACIRNVRPCQVSNRGKRVPQLMLRGLAAERGH